MTSPKSSSLSETWVWKPRTDAMTNCIKAVSTYVTSKHPHTNVSIFLSSLQSAFFSHPQISQYLSQEHKQDTPQSWVQEKCLVLQTSYLKNSRVVLPLDSPLFFRNMINIMASMILQKSEIENKTQARKCVGIFCFKEYIRKSTQSGNMMGCFCNYYKNSIA